jgi:hypothetical protein
MAAHAAVVFSALSLASTDIGVTLTGTSGAAAAATLVRQPYLQRVGATGATIVWATREPGDAEVRYRRGSAIVRVTATSTLYSTARTAMAWDYYQHEATLTGLNPATTYDYDIYHDGVAVVAAGDRVTTAPAMGTGRISFVAFGDSGSGTANQLRLADRISESFAAGRWDFALHTGDVVYPKGTYQYLHDRFFGVYEDWLRRYPIFLTIGNHEDYASDGRPYLDLFTLPTNGHTPRYPDQTERYYSFDYGPVHFVALDSQRAFSGDRRREQLNWLVRDLEATTQPWRIVFMHIPAYGSGDFAEAFNKRTALQPIFERYGVQLVLAGHEHDYARGVPWREGPSQKSPVMHVVTGGGGASLNTPVPGPWAAKWARAYHFVSVDVDDCTAEGTCTLSLQATDSDGDILDQFTFDLRAQRRDAEPPSVEWLAADPVVRDSVTLAASATDDERIVKVDLLVDGELRAVDTVAPYEWTWDTTRELNGQRRLELRAVDIAGRTSVSDARTVRVANDSGTVDLLSPGTGERVSTRAAYSIRWAAGAGKAPFKSFHVAMAPNGKTFTPVAGCETLPASARTCVWSAPGPVTNHAVVQVTAVDTAGGKSVTTSGTFRVQSTAPTLAVKFPDTPTTVGIGSTHALTWATSLAFYSPWNIELSRDAGAAWETLSSQFFALQNQFRWVVAGPATSQGRVRVSAVNTTLQDQSQSLFTIAPATLAVQDLAASTVWTAGARVKVKWTTNLGAYDQLNVRLSVDGGLSFPIVLAGSVPAADKLVTITVPSIATTQARVRIESLVNDSWSSTSSTNFRIAVP